jgi:hypothetical protein
LPKYNIKVFYLYIYITWLFYTHNGHISKCFLVMEIKWKTNKYYTVGTTPKSNIKIVEIGDTLYTLIYTTAQFSGLAQTLQ